MDRAVTVVIFSLARAVKFKKAGSPGYDGAVGKYTVFITTVGGTGDEEVKRAMSRSVKK